MKKFYSLFAAALVAGTAMAISPRQLSQQEVYPADNFQTAIEQSRKAVMTDGVVVKGDKVSTSGTNWTVRMNVNPDRWVDLLVFGADRVTYPFEVLPYYWASLYMYDSDAASTAATRLYFDACWPAQAYLDHSQEDDWWIDEDNFDWDRAVEEYGSLEAAQAPASIESMAEVMTAEQFPLYEYPYGYLPGYYGLFNMQLFGAYNCVYKGTSPLWLKPGVAGSTSISMEGAAYLLFNSYDSETMDVDYTIYAPMGPTDDAGGISSVTVTLSDQVQETASVFGWDPINLTPSEVHIFNVGEASADLEIGTLDGSIYAMGDLFEDFEPSQLYYVAYCTSPLTFEGTYNETSLPEGPTVEGSEYPANDQYNFFTNYVTLDLNSDPENTNPEGLAALMDWEGDSSGFLVNVIKPGLLFSGYYRRDISDSLTAAQLLGATGYLYAWGGTPYPGDEEAGGIRPKVGFGDKTNGFNSHFSTSLGAVVNVKFTGEVNFHYSADDYTLVRKVPAVGNADANTLSVKGIASESFAPVVGTEYYNFQGIRLNNAPEQGIYIVREVKADGTVSTKKVAK